MIAGTASPGFVNVERESTRLSMNIDLNSSTIFASLFWGTIGTGYWIYGWKQKDMVAWFGGVGLIAISYFISSAILMSLAGVLLMVAVYLVKKYQA
jgi:hypothetical protein